MTYVIERGVKIPNRKAGPLPGCGGPGRKKDPHSRAGRIRALKPGESVFFANYPQSRASALTFYVRKKFANRNFTTRLQKGGVRVWRIK